MKGQLFQGVATIFILVLLSATFMFCDDDNTVIDNSVPIPDSTENCSVEDGIEKIFFIGASYFFTLPQHFEGLANTKNKTVLVDAQIAGGAMLSYHASSDDTEEVINSENWDWIVLQGVCTNAAFPETAHQIFPPYREYPLIPSIESIKNKAEVNCENTRIIYQMPWAFEDGTTWLSGYNHSYFELQQLVYDNVIKFPDDLGIKISPVGWAWRQVMIERQDIKLFESDFNHPSVYGSYLLACVMYTSIFNETITGSDYFGGLDEEVAKYLQEVASSIVLNNRELWE